MKVKVQKIFGTKEYKVIFSQGVQSFTLDYRASLKECRWMKKMLEMAFESYEKEILERNDK